MRRNKRKVAFDKKHRNLSPSWTRTNSTFEHHNCHFGSTSKRVIGRRSVLHRSSKREGAYLEKGQLYIYNFALYIFFFNFGLFLRNGMKMKLMFGRTTAAIQISLTEK